VERRFQSPYKHWVVGLAVELLSFAAFLAVTSLLALAASRVL